MGAANGVPLTSWQVIINLIAGTTTETGLKVHAELDPNTYATGRKVTKSELESLNLTRATFHGEWNDFISPTKT